MRIEALNRILNTMAQNNVKPYPITASIGFAIRKFGGNTNIEDIINTADERMYRYKVEHKRQRMN